MTDHARAYLELLDRPPQQWVDGIPVYSATSDYLRNYARIASDHLAETERSGHNPFIPEYLWQESEASTRAILQKYVHAGDRVLDVGVGLGRLIGDMADLDRFGIDISLEYLRLAHAKGIAVAYALIEDMPFRDASFDAVIATDVLEHVLDLNDSLRHIMRVLKPDGVLVIRVPYREDLGPYLAPEMPYDFVHIRAFDEDSLRLLFNKVFDCDVVEVRKAGYAAIASHLRSASRGSPHVLWARSSSDL